MEALARLGYDDPSVFLRGLRHIQFEPVYGGRVDTAVDLRGASAFGLVESGGRLLADPGQQADAAEARPRAAPLASA